MADTIAPGAGLRMSMLATTTRAEKEAAARRSSSASSSAAASASASAAASAAAVAAAHVDDEDAFAASPGGTAASLPNPHLLRGCVFALAGTQWQTPLLMARLIAAHGGRLSPKSADSSSSSSSHSVGGNAALERHPSEPPPLDDTLPGASSSSSSHATEAQSEAAEIAALDIGEGRAVGAEVTHVLSSDEMAAVHGNPYKAQFFPDFEDQMRAAEMLSIPVVSGRWLEQSIRAGKVLPTAEYLIFGQQGDPDSLNLESKLDPRVQTVVELLFDETSQQQAMLSLDLDASRVASVSDADIRAAYGLLAQVEDAVALKSVASRASEADATLARLSREFYALIPHTGANPTIATDAAMKAKLSVLAALSDIVVAQRSMKDASLRGAYSMSPIDLNYQKLHATLTPLESWTVEYDVVAQAVANTRCKEHDYFDIKLRHIFEVDRAGEAERYAPFSKLKHRRLLWHGSRLANWIGILSNGIRIAPKEAPVTGYFLGKGAYFADMVSKSAEYTCTTKDRPQALLALCEVALGRPLQIAHTKFIEKEDLDDAHFHSVKGCGTLGPDPAFNKELEDGSIIALGKEADMGVLRSELPHSEFVVYDTDQVRIRYLVLVDIISDRDVKPKSLINAN